MHRYRARGLDTADELLCPGGEPAQGEDKAAALVSEARELIGKLELDAAQAKVMEAVKVGLAPAEMQALIKEIGTLKGQKVVLGSIESAVEPVWVYLTGYRVLRAHADPRADEVLEKGRRLLQETAFKIDDEALRRSYLENVPANREMAALWAVR